MRMVEASEAATFAEQQAAAEMEKQKREWEAARRLLERPPTPPQPESDPATRDLLTFSRQDSVNQVSDRPVTKRLQAVRKSTAGESPRLKSKRDAVRLRNSNKPPQSPVQTEDDCNTEQNSVSPDDSVSETSNSVDSGSNFSDASNLTVPSVAKFPTCNSKKDSESPRTRSRGTVKINLWTLDVNPVLPDVKPVIKNSLTKRLSLKKSSSDLICTARLKRKKKFNNHNSCNSDGSKSPSVLRDSTDNDISINADVPLDNTISENADDKENPFVDMCKIESNVETGVNDIVANETEKHESLSKPPTRELVRKKRKIICRVKGTMQNVSNNRTLDSWIVRKAQIQENNHDIIAMQPVVSIAAMPLGIPHTHSHLVIRTRRASANPENHLVKKVSKTIKIISKPSKANETMNEI